MLNSRAAGIPAAGAPAWRRAAAGGPLAALRPRPGSNAQRRAPWHGARPSASVSDAGAAAAPDAPLLRGVCSVLTAAVLLKGAAGALAPAQLLAASLGPAAAAGGGAGAVNAALTAVGTSVCWVYAAWLISLKEALDHGRLGSDTYKRLALSLAALSAGLVALIFRYRGVFEGGPLGPGAVVGLTAASMAVTCWLASGLYQIGSGGATPLFDAPEALRQFGASVRSCLARPADLYSAYYSYLALSSLVLFAWLFPTDATPLFPGGLDAAGRFLTRATAAGMWLVGVTAFTLKDAADRGRLGASTFKLLNLALAATIGQQVWFFYSLGSTGVALSEPLWYGILGPGVAGAAVCLTAYLTAKKK
ncbi:MAG: hypothetical protein J3K34DRAFT_7902 [Monoraphidium minutum]|nr:MAG: hypothetical protein J3K34DRAFT_7902 [Monoraphidium minutum]